MQNIVLRPATSADLEKLRDFEQGVIQYERPFSPQLKPDPILYYDIEDLMERADACLVVAEVEGEVIGSGYALIQQAKSIKKDPYHAYLGFMFVQPAYRGKGVNGQIINYLMEWSKERNIAEIVLDVYAENESALKAYEKIGFQPDMLSMRLNTAE